MTNAGWYPDPAGAPDTYRYWDGQSWSQMTTTTPPAAPAAPATPAAPAAPAAPEGYGALPPVASPTPAPYGGPGQPGGPWSPAPPAGGPGGPSGPGGPDKVGSTGKTVVIVIAAVLVLVLLGLGGFFGVRALTGDDDSSTASDPDTSESTDGSDGTDETDSTGDSDETDGTDGPTDPSTSSTIRPTGIQCTGGEPEPAKDPGATPKLLTGGGLMVPRPKEFEASLAYSDAHGFADGITVAVREATDKWINEIAVGGLALANGFTSPEQAAEIVMQCLTTNPQIYAGFESRTDLTNEAIKVDGHNAWRITSELRISDAQIDVEGDVTTIVIVDTGNPDAYGLFLTAATLGEVDQIAVAERALSNLTLD